MAQKNFSGFCITLSTSDAVVVTEQDQMRNHNDLTSFHLIRKLFDQQIIWSEGQWKWKKLLPPLSWSPLGQFSEGRRMSQEKVFRELLTFHPASVWSFQLELGVQQRANHLRLHSIVSEAALMVKVHLVIGGLEEWAIALWGRLVLPAWSSPCSNRWGEIWNEKVSFHSHHIHNYSYHPHPHHPHKRRPQSTWRGDRWQERIYLCSTICWPGCPYTYHLPSPLWKTWQTHPSCGCRAYFYFRPHFRSNATTSTFTSFSPSQNKLKFLPPMRPMPDVFISRWLPCIPAFPSAICRLVILPLLPVSSSENHFWRRHHDSNLPIIRERGSPLQLIRKQTCLWQTEGKKEQASGLGALFS